MPKGFKHSLEAKKKISLARKGKPSWNKGIPFSEETREKMSLAQKGKKLSEEHKRKISEKLKGRLFSEETRKRISLATQGKHYGFLGKKHSEEFKKNRSIDMKKRRPFMVITKKNTSIELKLQNWLKEQNIPFETHYPILGQPDIFIKPNICIFADGCYWHKCPDCGFGHKRERDKMVTGELQKQGYTVIRLWEHEINNNQFNGLNQLYA